MLVAENNMIVLKENQIVFHHSVYVLLCDKVEVKMKMNEKRRAIFFAVSNDERRENLAFSNFVFSLCKVCMQQKAKGKDGKEVELSSIYDVEEFVRHDMIVEDNIRESVF